MNRVISDTESVYTEKFSVKSYETDARGRATIQAVCSYFQEIGFNHAALLMSEVESVDKNTAFVLTRLHVKIKRYPVWKEKIEIRTWLSPLDSNYAIRNFEIFDPAGDLIGTGLNSALFFDLARRKPVPVPDEVKSIPVLDRRALDDEFRHVDIPEVFDHSLLIDVKYSDIDMYRHVNNVRYVDWALDAVPLDTRGNSSLLEVEIAFRSETDFPDKILSEIAQDNGQFVHRITRKSDGKVSALLKTRWGRES